MAYKDPPEPTTLGTILAALGLVLAVALWASTFALAASTGPSEQPSPAENSTLDTPTPPGDDPTPYPNETYTVDYDGDGTPDRTCEDNVECYADELPAETDRP